MFLPFLTPCDILFRGVGRCDSYNLIMRILVDVNPPINILFRLIAWQNATKAMFFLVCERPGWTELVRCAVCAASKTLFPSSWNELCFSPSLQAQRTLKNRSPDYPFDPKLHLAKYQPWSILETPSKFLLLGWWTWWWMLDSLIYSYLLLHFT